METPKKIFTVYLERPFHNQLLATAKSVDCTASKFVRDAIKEKLLRVEREGKSTCPIFETGQVGEAVAV